MPLKLGVQGPKEFDSKNANIADNLFPEDAGRDGRSLAGNQARRGGRGSGDREMYDLLGAQDVSGGDTGTGGTNVQGFGEFDELDTGGVGAANKNGHL